MLVRSSPRAYGGVPHDGTRRRPRSSIADAGSFCGVWTRHHIRGRWMECLFAVYCTSFTTLTTLIPYRNDIDNGYTVF